MLARRAPPTLDRHLIWHVKTTLDVPAMRLAADRLIGKHDFTTFRSADCQARSPVKTLDLSDVERIDTVGAWIVARTAQRHGAHSHSQYRTDHHHLVKAQAGQSRCARGLSRCSPLQQVAM